MNYDEIVANKCDFLSQQIRQHFIPEPFLKLGFILKCIDTLHILEFSHVYYVVT